MKVGAKILLISLLTTLFGCQPKSGTVKNGKIQVVTTTGMVQDAAVRLMGEHADVVALMGPGVDPHLYQATPGDLAKMNKADVIIYSGLFLEGKLQGILQKLSTSRQVIDFSGAIDRNDLLTATNAKYAEEVYDPHIWFDIDVWSQGISGLADALSDIYPQWEGEIRQHAEDYLAELAALKTELIDAFAIIPVEDRIMVTSHDAFHYFGRMLNIRVEALQGLSTATDFGLQDRKNLVNLIISENIRAIFMESSVSDKPIRAILADCKEKGKAVNLGGTLFSDAMGAEGSAEGTYSGMLRHNVYTVINGLKHE